MSNYTLLIAWSVAGCSLAAVLLMYWRYRHMVRHYNNYIMKYIREHDLLAKELEYAHIEKKNDGEVAQDLFFERSYGNKRYITLPRLRKKGGNSKRAGPMNLIVNF